MFLTHYLRWFYHCQIWARVGIVLFNTNLTMIELPILFFLMKHRIIFPFAYVSQVGGRGV